MSPVKLPCIYAIALSILVALSPPVGAATFQPSAYLSIKAQQHSMRIGDTRFTLPAASLTGGFWFRQGIGLELEFSRSLTDEQRNGIETELDHMLSLGLRLESPPNDDLAVYFVFALSAAEVASRFTEIETRSLGSSLDGYGVTFGFVWQSAVPGLALDLGATHNRLDDDIGVNTLHIGLRYTLGVQR